MKCIIIEDQAPARRIIQKYVSEIQSLQLINSFASALDGIDFLKTHSVDLIFLDIHLPKLSGIDFIKSLTNPPAVILTTAFTKYAVQGYELDIVDYLVKPFSFERFLQAVNKVELRTANQNILANSKEKVFFIKSGHEYIKVNPNEILFIKSDMDYTEVHLANKKHISPDTLNHWEKILYEYQFVRVHKSYLVHVTLITKVSGNTIYFNDQTFIPIGRAYKDNFLSSYVKHGSKN